MLSRRVSDRLELLVKCSLDRPLIEILYRVWQPHRQPFFTCSWSELGIMTLDNPRQKILRTTIHIRRRRNRMK